MRLEKSHNSLTILAQNNKSPAIIRVWLFSFFKLLYICSTKDRRGNRIVPSFYFK